MATIYFAVRVAESRMGFSLLLLKYSTWRQLFIAAHATVSRMGYSSLLFKYSTWRQLYLLQLM
jgi:hypothetical protein